MRRAKALAHNKLKVMKALNLISSSLEQEHSLAVVSRQCASSRFHFHRVFKQETGETLSEAIRRLRLERVAKYLCSSRIYNMSRLAAFCGFSSSQNMAKSFRRHFGLSPSDYRLHMQNSKHGNDIPAAIQYLDDLDADNEATAFASIRELAAREVVYARQTGNYGQASCAHAFLALSELLGYTPDFQTTPVLAVYWDYPLVTPPNKCRTDMCAQLPDLVDQRVTQQVPGGRYAVFSCAGDEALLAQAWHAAAAWMDRHGYELGDSPCYELYLPGTQPELGWYAVEIHMPIGEPPG